MSLGTQQPLEGGEGRERDSPESLQEECSLGAIMILVYWDYYTRRQHVSYHFRETSIGPTFSLMLGSLRCASDCGCLASNIFLLIIKEFSLNQLRARRFMKIMI